MHRNLTGFEFSPQITGIISVVDKMVPFLCSPPDPDGKISPFLSRIKVRECMSDAMAVLSHEGGIMKEVLGSGLISSGSSFGKEFEKTQICLGWFCSSMHRLN